MNIYHYEIKVLIQTRDLLDGDPLVRRGSKARRPGWVAAQWASGRGEEGLDRVHVRDGDTFRLCVWSGASPFP